MKKYIYILTTILAACFFRVNVYASVSYDLVEKKIYLAIDEKNVTSAEFSCDDGYSNIFQNDNISAFGATINLNSLSDGAHYCKLTYSYDKNGSTKTKTDIKRTLIYVREPLNDTNGTCVLTIDTSGTGGDTYEDNCKKSGCKFTGKTCEAYNLSNSNSSGTNSSGTASSSGNTGGSTIYDTSDDNLDNCSVLGSFKTDLENILKAFKIFSVCFASVVTAYEYLSVVFMKNADDLKKANNRLIKRLCLIAALWLLPSLLNVLLSLVDSGTCIS